jgi:hypothetical protein
MAHRNSYCYGLKTRLLWTKLSKGSQQTAESWNCGYVMCTGPQHATQKQLIRNDNVTVCNTHTVYFTLSFWQMTEWTICVLRLKLIREQVPQYTPKVADIEEDRTGSIFYAVVPRTITSRLTISAFILTFILQSYLA